ncbi:hypothetical protein [Breoghania sp. L-A4]|uniref:hypothetical protein n=1 Tax=Breoghania sp. L-A4 TaxID=2304600 RepID=UPI0013C2AED1|nr:hypothetical protein [Breoghania sp. L-A4]
MNPSDPDFTRQDEDIPPAIFEAEERADHRFGNWPEAAGLVFTVFVVWLMFAFTG